MTDRTKQKPKMETETNGQPEILDPFSPKALRLTEPAQIGVKRAITTISCRKPNRQQFVRVHPDPEYRLQTAIFTDEINRETYLVHPSLWEAIPENITPHILFAAVSRPTNQPFLWPVRVPDLEGRKNDWHVSMLRAAERAMDCWVRVQSVMPDNSYHTYEATGDLPEPERPELSLHEMLRICFSDRIIDSLNHRILKDLRGEA